MTGKIIDFKSGKPKEEEAVIESSGNVFEDLNVESPIDLTNKPPAQEALEAALTRNFKDVIIIGISENNTTCMLSVNEEKAIFELTHAIYQLNKQVDGD